MKYVTYEEFGAKGDGVTNDFPAIYAAHVYANENGLPVKANDNATYYIKETWTKEGDLTSIASAPIMTETDWGNANFIIDDTEIIIPPPHPASTYTRLTYSRSYPTTQRKELRIRRSLTE